MLKGKIERPGALKSEGNVLEMGHGVVWGGVVWYGMTWER
jgi:hypothetical protein